MPTMPTNAAIIKKALIRAFVPPSDDAALVFKVSTWSATLASRLSTRSSRRSILVCALSDSLTNPLLYLCVEINADDVQRYTGDDKPDCIENHLNIDLSI